MNYYCFVENFICIYDNGDWKGNFFFCVGRDLECVVDFWM